jgi:hypothetical protein
MITESAAHASLEATQEFTRKASALRAQVDELAASAPDAVKEQLAGLKDEIASLCDQGMECTESITKRVMSTVTSHPIHVAAAAVGVGLLTWWLISRRE